ncbi:MAG TPA: hypothetical protein VGV64_02315 [Thermoplasmata archaeon]|nr:hypothetical protein [Thermoplasmata archaeon]
MPDAPAPSPDAPPAPIRLCSACAQPLTAMGSQPIRTGGVPGHPDAVLWLDTFWCPRCGKVDFFTVA